MSFPSTIRWIGTAVGIFGIVCMCGGCGKPGFAPVTGQVTLSGKPVGPGTIIFQPDTKKGTEGKSSMGRFGPDGKYTLVGAGDVEGALIGHHQVIIQGGGSAEAEFGEEGAEIGPGSAISLRYADPQKGGLTAEVTEGDNVLNFDLRP